MHDRLIDNDLYIIITWCDQSQPIIPFERRKPTWLFRLKFKWLDHHIVIVNQHDDSHLTQQAIMILDMLNERLGGKLESMLKLVKLVEQSNVPPRLISIASLITSSFKMNLETTLTKVVHVFLLQQPTPTIHHVQSLLHNVMNQYESLMYQLTHDFLYNTHKTRTWAVLLGLKLPYMSRKRLSRSDKHHNRSIRKQWRF